MPFLNQDTDTKSKNVWLKRFLFSAMIIFFVISISGYIASLLVTEKFIKKNICLALENNLNAPFQLGKVVFHWPNQVRIASLAVQSSNKEAGRNTTHFKDIHGIFQLLPLLLKKIVVKEITVKQINYENCFLIEDLVTDTFRLEGRTVFTRVRFTANGGHALIEGFFELKRNKTAFDIFIRTNNVHLTHDMPFIRNLSLFTAKGAELGGMLSLEGSVAGKYSGGKILNKKFNGNITLEINDGYIKSNSLSSFLSDIVKVKNLYLFDLIEAEVQIKKEKFYTPEVQIISPPFNVNASGVTGFRGKILYDATLRFNKEYQGDNLKKVAGLSFTNNTLPLEIKGTVKKPRVSVTLTGDNLEQVMKGLVNDFLRSQNRQ